MCLDNDIILSRSHSLTQPHMLRELVSSPPYSTVQDTVRSALVKALVWHFKLRQSSLIGWPIATQLLVNWVHLRPQYSTVAPGNLLAGVQYDPLFAFPTYHVPQTLYVLLWLLAMQSTLLSRRFALLDSLYRGLRRRTTRLCRRLLTSPTWPCTAMSRYPYVLRPLQRPLRVLL